MKVTLVVTHAFYISDFSGSNLAWVNIWSFRISSIEQVFYIVFFCFLATVYQLNRIYHV
jgi:hypothetical protein